MNDNGANPQGHVRPLDERIRLQIGSLVLQVHQLQMELDQMRLEHVPAPATPQRPIPPPVTHKGGPRPAVPPPPPDGD